MLVVIMRTTVAIVGTAGRKNDAARMSRELFERMCQRTTQIIERELHLDWKNICIQSGGAAWSDHVAVRLFLQRPETTALKVYLPCPLDGNARYRDTGSYDWRTNPGRTSNFYHSQFTKAIGTDSLQELLTAQQRGAVLDTSGTGFHSRNSMIAKCDILIAFSWSDGDQPWDGGTSDTWRKCKGRKVHVPLSLLCIEPESKRIKSANP